MQGVSSAERGHEPADILHGGVLGASAEASSPQPPGAAPIANAAGLSSANVQRLLEQSTCPITQVILC